MCFFLKKLIQTFRRVNPQTFPLCTEDTQGEDTREDGPLVRTYEVEVTPRGARSINYPSPKYKLTEMTVPIQRLCVFLPIEEQGSIQSDTLGEIEADQDELAPQDEAEHHDALPEAEAEDGQ